MKASARTATAVYRQLLEDFPKESLDWIRAAHWFGPVDVKTSRIDFSNEKSWAAYHEPERVAKFAKLMASGVRKPIVLVQTPNKTTLTVIDGHHRATAARQVEMPALAYIARVHAASGPWDTLHDSQRHGPSILDMTDSGDAVALDLNVSDVHQPGAGANYRKGPPTAPPKELPMADLTTKQRKALPKSAFADPANRAYPIENKAHADNAAARLEQQKSSMSPAKYKAIKSRIRAAQRRFGEKPKAAAMGAGVRVRARLGAGGHLHVTHAMGQDKTFAARLSLPLPGNAAGEEGKSVWVQLAKSGHFEGHSAGPFDLNAGIFSQIIRNFKEVNQGKVPFDFEHASAMPPNSGSIPTEGAPAQGWIRDLRIDGGNLFGLVEWKEPARTYIREGKYQHVSPVIKFGFKDPVTGENRGARLVSAALTNDPFLTGMMPVAASAAMADGLQVENVTEVAVADASAINVVLRSGSLAHAPHEYMGRLKAALYMSELASASEVSGELQRLRDMHEADMGSDMDGMHEGVELNKYRMPLRELVAAAPGDTWEKVFDVVQDLIDAAIDQHNIEEHGAEPSMTMTDDPEPGEPAGEPAMSNPGVLAGHTGDTMATEDKNAIALTSAQSELETTKKALADATAKVAAAEAQASEFTLKLTAANAAHAQLSEQVTALLTAQQARDSKELEAKVDAAIRDYPEKGLTVAMRDSLLGVAKTNGAFFDTMYPAKNPATAHLLTNLTGSRPQGAPPATLEGGNGVLPGNVVTMSIADLADQIASQRKIPLEAAQSIAMSIAAQTTIRRPTAA